MSFTEKEVDALNCIRWLSTIAIIVCHILQKYNNEWAYLFNIGVQIFFFLSGFLYGRKRITDTKAFFIKRFIKIYIPYIIWVGISILFLYLYTQVSIKPSDYFNLLFLRDTITGLRHLWFIKVLFLCYLLLPLIDKLFNRLSLVVNVIFLLVGFFGVFFIGNSTFIWCFIYYLGFFCGRYDKSFLPIILISLTLILGVSFYTDINIKIFSVQSTLVYLLKGMIATFIFLLSYLLLRNLKFITKISRVLSNSGGYFIYLTHGLFILGPLSVLEFSNSYSFNIILALSLSILSAWCLYLVSNLIGVKINKSLKNGARNQNK